MYKEKKFHSAMRTKEVRLAIYGKTLIAGGTVKPLTDFLKTRRGAKFSLLSLEGLASLTETDLYREFGEYSPLALTRRVLLHPECTKDIAAGVMNIIEEIGETANFYRANPRSVYNPKQLHTLCEGMYELLYGSNISYMESAYEGSDQQIFFSASELFGALAYQFTKALPPPARDAVPISTFEWVQYVLHDFHAENQEVQAQQHGNNIADIVDAALNEPEAEFVGETEPIQMEEETILSDNDVLPVANNSEDINERVVVPEQTITDTLLYPDQRTRFDVTGSAVFDFKVALRMTRPQIEAYLPIVQRAVNKPNVCVALGEDNSISITITVDELVNSPTVGESAGVHSHNLLYDNMLAIGKLIDAIHDAFISMAHKEHELSSIINGGIL